MTKVKDVFPTIFTGVNVKNYASSTGTNYKIFNKEAMLYSTLDTSKFSDYISSDVNDKYVMKGRDVIISLKKPFIAATLTHSIDNVIIQNNFAVLRNIDMSKYSYIFVTNYLNYVWLDKYMESHSELSLEDIKEIELPDIPKEEQMVITDLCNSLNERSSIVLSILENDKKIIKELFNNIL